MRLALTLPLLALTACAPGEPLTFEQNPVQVQRAWANAFSDQPFDTGPVTILTEEHGELHSYTLAPCRGGATVCAGSTHGRAATLQMTPDYAVVTGAYAGRTFYLSPGGDGWMKKNGQFVPLAWDDESPISNWAVTRVTDQGQGLETRTQ
ncbi:hypothetical protein AB3Y40_18810 [Yoonia sp. R2331]|uniref:hypothetical protein n=1 Tax=Yoonia sp. R2331 TaxID=3237238 RepID=UPI0034E52B00